MYVLDENDPAEKAQKVALTKNRNAMNKLVSALGTVELMNMVMLEKKRDSDWPSGKFPPVYKEIKDLFAPDDDIAEMERDEELSKIGLEKKKDPKKLLEEIAAIEVRYGCALSQAKKAAVIIRAGKRDYAAVMTVTGTAIGTAKSRAATANELTAEMHKQWRIMGNTSGAGKKGDDDDDDSGHETALTTTNCGPKCYNCGKNGHKALNCPENSNNINDGGHLRGGKAGAARFKGACNHCGKIGHKESTCWIKNPQLRNGGTSGAAIEYEVLVSCI